VTTVWIGFDKPRSIYKYGAQAALPIWIQFMKHALRGQPEASMAQPNGIVTARIDRRTGHRAYPGEPNAIFEAFRSQNVPKQRTARPYGRSKHSAHDNNNSAIESAQLF